MMPRPPQPDPIADPLPGLGDGPAAGPGRLVAAVRRTFAALDADDLLEERHAGLLALALELAQSVEAGAAARRASAVAMAARELRELLAALPAPEEGGDDEWSRFEREYREAAAGGSPAVRDAARPDPA